MLGAFKFFRGQERRRHVRVIPRPSEPIEVQIMGSDFLEVLHADDISAGGIAIYVPRGFSKAEIAHQVKLVITLPGERCFTAAASIRNFCKQRGNGRFGLEFVAIDQKKQNLIQRYVQNMVDAGRGA